MKDVITFGGPTTFIDMEIDGMHCVEFAMLLGSLITGGCFVWCTELDPYDLLVPDSDPVCSLPSFLRYPPLC